MELFRAFQATSEGERGVVEMSVDELPDDGALVEVHWSSVNYKDGLASTPTGKVARISPLVPGVDLAGVLVDDAPGMPAGTAVIAHGYDLGVSRHGGFARFARVPHGWLVPLPDGLTAREAMIVGTAGFTAAMSVIALQEHGVTPERGPVLVTGATGGVGSTAVGMLAGLGYEVVASTGKPASSEFLHALGANAVIDRAELAGGVVAAARVDGVGRCRRLRRRRDAGQRAEAHPLRRVRRRQRPHRWQRPACDGAAVHPPRRQPARHRLGDDPDRSPASGVGARSPPTSSRPVSTGSGTTSRSTISTPR